jgi:hypothetical protein
MAAFDPLQTFGVAVVWVSATNGDQLRTLIFL